MMSREPLITAAGRNDTDERPGADRRSNALPNHSAPSRDDGTLGDRSHGTETPTGPEPLELDASETVRPATADTRRNAGLDDARCSPDPFVATDRYRLTMPYDDRI